MECASLHRSFGVHLTFVRSTLLDTWNAKQIKLMQLGGNDNSRNFFRQHGFEDQVDQGKLFQKYNSRAAEQYRNKLKKLAEGDSEENKQQTSFLDKEFKENKQNNEVKKNPKKQKIQIMKIIRRNTKKEGARAEERTKKRTLSSQKNQMTKNPPTPTSTSPNTTKATHKRLEE